MASSATTGSQPADLSDLFNATDRCRFYPDTVQKDGEICRVQRTCYDCLDTQFEDGLICGLNREGQCIPANELFKGDYIFRADQHTYCDIKDELCKTCIPSASSNDTSCRGANGCICFSACQYPKMDICSSFDSLDLSFSDFRDTFLLTSALIGLSIVLCCLVGVWWYRRSQRRNLQNAAAQSADQPKPSQPAMELTNWKSYRQKLIEDEESRLNETTGQPKANVLPMV